MRKLLVLPLMLVAMPCAFALNTNPTTSSYGSHAACGRACTLSYCYSKIEHLGGQRIVLVCAPVKAKQDTIQ